jgi:hypothetical protein
MSERWPALHRTLSFVTLGAMLLLVQPMDVDEGDGANAVAAAEDADDDDGRVSPTVRIVSCVCARTQFVFAARAHSAVLPRRRSRVHRHRTVSIETTHRLDSLLDHACVVNWLAIHLLRVVFRLCRSPC